MFMKNQPYGAALWLLTQWWGVTDVEKVKCCCPVSFGTLTKALHFSVLGFAVYKWGK